jgi:Cu+-exporting ATPase
MKKLFFLFVLAAFVSCNSGNKNTNAEKPEADQPKVEVVETTINISGMHCDMCVASITKGVNELAGIDSVKVSLEDSTAFVVYETGKVELAEIEKAIEKRGYTVKSGM